MNRAGGHPVPPGNAPVRHVLITRTPRDCRELQDLLEGSGIVLKPYPVLRFEPVRDDRGWRRAIGALESSDRSGVATWLLLASPRAPQPLRAEAERRNLTRLLELPAAAVGVGTARAARAAGLRVEVTGPGTGAGLARLLGDSVPPSALFLFPCGVHRRPELPTALEEAGHTVVPVEVYRMRPTPPRELPPLGPAVDAVVLTSPRAARLYVESLGGHPLPCPHWAMGPTTRDAADALGISCRIPDSPDLASLAADLRRAL